MQINSDLLSNTVKKLPLPPLPESVQNSCEGEKMSSEYAKGLRCIAAFLDISGLDCSVFPHNFYHECHSKIEYERMTNMLGNFTRSCDGENVSSIKYFPNGIKLEIYVKKGVLK